MTWRDRAAPFSFKAPKRDEYDEQLYATLTSFQHPIWSYPEHFLIMARMGLNWGDPRGWPSATLGKKGIFNRFVLAEWCLRTVPAGLQMGLAPINPKPSYQDVTFSGKAVVVDADAAGRQVRGEREESGGETKEPLARKCRVTQSIGGMQQQVENVGQHRGATEC
ncbi:hypothetical protein L1987_20887 [Smallanthus sonchifolius]|uniref:Uncharacterized protein n=1 Tax=Smallanthus sonchifolius TaxID=185202 RepID=A0ACB9IT20_9ASTR|nr:hypothetical protein L1987_20887 [Smallanthus sonchifolius]